MKNFFKTLGTQSRRLCTIALIAVIGFSMLGCPDDPGEPPATPPGGEPPAGSTYGISLTKGGSSFTSHTFPSAMEGYSQQGALTVTVTNTGTAATGELTAALSGTNADSFTIGGSPISSIAAGGTATFTVRPNNDLDVEDDPYTATVTVTGGNSISASFTVSFSVTGQPDYGVTLFCETEPFGTADYKYAAYAPTDVWLTNIGKQATGPLSVTLTGTNAASFTIVSNIGNINIGSAEKFTVKPNDGLNAGSYTATVLVKGVQHAVIEANLDLSFTVNKATPVIGDFDINGTTTGTIDWNEFVEVEVTKNDPAIGAITVKYNGGTTGFRKPGTYTVTFDVAESTNYTAFSHTLGTFTIKEPPTFTSLTGSGTNDLGGYLNWLEDNTADDPHPIVLDLNLGTTSQGSGSWYNLYYNIIAANLKYVDLDLFACSMEGTGFGAFAFSSDINEKDKVVNIVLPASTETIGSYAFRTFTSLSNFIIGSNITTIQNNAFEWTSLTSIIIPANVTYIGTTAFNSCHELTSVTFEAAGINIGERAFPGQGYGDSNNLREAYLAGGAGTYIYDKRGIPENWVWTKQ